MKSLAEIKNLATSEDYDTVAHAVGKSKELVRKIVAGKRTDTSNVQLAFNIHFTHLEDIKLLASQKATELREEMVLIQQGS
jgi:hypothetical protein